VRDGEVGKEFAWCLSGVRLPMILAVRLNEA
jgi:hypothetical protein